MPRMLQKRQLLVGDLPHNGVDACDRPLLVPLEIKVGQEIPGAARHASVRQVLFEAMVRLAGLQDAVIDPFQLGPSLPGNQVRKLPPDVLLDGSPVDLGDLLADAFDDEVRGEIDQSDRDRGVQGIQSCADALALGQRLVEHLLDAFTDGDIGVRHHGAAVFRRQWGDGQQKPVRGGR
ncbi:MAG: hypothetical protein AUH21_03415 [Nitrospirae bacterium 13_2_20CM_62_7]|nr:MAG: hypothetical protein AUH21_03415 [Nitrospirae bacterium 13_2_20CM_62_7]